MNNYLVCLILGLVAGCYVPYFYFDLIRPIFILLALVFVGFFTLIYCKSHTRWFVRFGCVLIGVIYSSYWVQQQVSHRLPLDLDKSLVEMEVNVLNTTIEPLRVSLWLKPLTLYSDDSEYAVFSFKRLRFARLGWYWHSKDDKKRVLAQADCQKAVITAVLRAPKNMGNHQSFDYEAYLLLRKQDASGYIKTFRCISSDKTEFSINDWRINWIHYLQVHLPVSSFNWVNALVFGDKSALSASVWDKAKATSTIHLFVVSGLHLSLLAGFIHFVVLACLRIGAFTFKTSLYRSRLPIALLVLLICAVYAWLSGLGVSVQRAWVMLLVVYTYWLLPIKPPVMLGVLLALAALLIYQPLVHTSSGFSYSFAAVLTLLVVFKNRKTNWFESLWLPQWCIFLVMLGVSSYWLGSMSSVSLLANFLAIPFLAFIVLPLSFVLAIYPVQWLSYLHNLSTQALDSYLSLCLNIPSVDFLYLSYLEIFLWFIFLSILIFNARGVWQFVCVFLALFCYYQNEPTRQVGIRILDVGQGQSMLVATDKSLLVYDLGPTFSHSFNAGDAIVAPAIWRLGFKDVDHLIISHSDNDHAGGFLGLQKTKIRIKNIWLGQPVFNINGKNCHQTGNDRWQRIDEHLRIRFLYYGSGYESDNNHSCVLQFDWYEQRWLVVGDISRVAEYQLVQNYANQLKSNALMAAHHGSKTSSSESFLKWVSPDVAFISAGFNNRFKHPHISVTQRLSRLQIKSYNTAYDGQISVNKLGEIQTYYQGYQVPWRQALKIPP